jgi:hypothetical protein
MIEIDFNPENMEKCLCAQCPVQAKSSCVKDQWKEMEEASSADIDSGFVVDPEKVPQLYCATGKTICGDLYFHEECQCKGCDVWKENDLAARGAPAYFCKNGEASECCEIDIGEDESREAKLRELRRTYYTPV